MSDLDGKKTPKQSEPAESFSDIVKKVVEKQLEEGNELPEEKKESNVIIKSEGITNYKLVDVPIFECREEDKPVVEKVQPISEVGVITAMTTITGNISSKGHIEIGGNVIGDVVAYGDIKITGKVAGDIEGGNIELNGCIIDGNVKARGDVTIGKDSTLSGNANGQLITIDGKIKGNVDAMKGVHMSSTSLVKGSITSPTLSMSAGAELQGKVSVARSELK